MKFTAWTCAALRGGKERRTALVRWRAGAACCGRVGRRLAALAIALPPAPPARAATPFDPDAVATWSAPMVSAVPSADQPDQQPDAAPDRPRQHRRRPGAGEAVEPMGHGPAGRSARPGGLRAPARTHRPRQSSRPLTFSGSPSFSHAGRRRADERLGRPRRARPLRPRGRSLPPGRHRPVSRLRPLTVRNGALQTNYVSSPAITSARVAFPAGVDPAAMDLLRRRST